MKILSGVSNPRGWAVASVIAVCFIPGCGNKTEPPRPADSVVAPERDFYLPFTGSGNDPFTGSGNDLYLANAADFNDITRVVEGEIRRPVVGYSVTIEDGKHLATPHVLVYEREGAWYRIWLGHSRTQAPVRLGAAGTVCGSRFVDGVLGDADQAMLIFSNPGADQACGNADDMHSSYGVSGAPDADPQDFPGLPLSPIYAATGELRGIVLIQGTSLVLMAFPSGDLTTLVDTLSAPVGKLASIPDGAWVRIGNEFRLVSLAAGLSPSRHETAEGFGIISGPTADAEYLYFSEVQTSSPDNLPARLWRLRLDGSAPAELIREFADERIDYVGDSESSIWLLNSMGETALLRRVDKASISDPPQLVERLERGGIAYVPGGASFAYDLQDLSANSETVKVNDGGQVLLYKENAALGGLAARLPRAYSPTGSTTASHVLVVEGAATNLATNYGGAKLISYNFETLQPVTLARFDASVFFVYGYSVGPVGLGRYYSAAGQDLFAFDVENGRFKVISTEPGISESPVVE